VERVLLKFSPIDILSAGCSSYARAICRIQIFCFELGIECRNRVLFDSQPNPESKAVLCWLTKMCESVFEDVNEFFCRPTDPSEPLANDLGIVRLPRGPVERRPASVEPAVPATTYATASALTSRFDRLESSSASKWSRACAYSWISVRARSVPFSRSRTSTSVVRRQSPLDPGFGRPPPRRVRAPCSERRFPAT